jgi:hypothetical protein
MSNISTCCSRAARLSAAAARRTASSSRSSSGATGCSASSCAFASGSRRAGSSAGWSTSSISTTPPTPSIAASNPAARFGDFQYSIDAQDASFLRRGVFPCYHPVDDNVPIDDGASDLQRDDWLKLIGLAYRDKRQAFARYSQYYLSTHGRVYWSDTMQLSTYVPDYAQSIHDAPDAARPDESLMIGELYVPPARLLAFMSAARRVLRDEGVEDIYGTIRAIRRTTSPSCRGRGPITRA